MEKTMESLLLGLLYGNNVGESDSKSYVISESKEEESTMELKKCAKCEARVMVREKVEGDVLCSRHRKVSDLENETKTNKEENVKMTNTKSKAVNMKDEAMELFNEMMKDLNGETVEEVETTKKEKDPVTKDTIMLSLLSAARTTKEVVSSGARKVGGFVKKHGLKSALGLGAITLAGTVTSGLASAIALGTGIYASVSLMHELIKTRRKNKKMNREQILRNLGSSILYSVAGGTAVYFTFYSILLTVYYAYSYSYLAFAYMTYFLLA